VTVWARFITWLAAADLERAFQAGLVLGRDGAVAEAARRRAYWQGREHAVALINVTMIARDAQREQARADRPRIQRVVD